MESSQALRAEAKPYTPLPPTFVAPPPFAHLPPPAFFPQAAPCPYQAPPPQAMGGFSGYGRTPLVPGGLRMHGAFPHPSWAPLMPAPHGAIAVAIPAGTTPGIAARLLPQGADQHPSGPVRTVCAPGARPRPRLDVPPRLLRAACPGAPAAWRAAKAAGAGGDEGAVTEEAANENEPSPRSVLSTTSTSPPFTPTTPSFPFPCPPPATGARAAPTELPHSAELGAVTSPPAGLRKTRCQRGHHRSKPVPRLLFDPCSKRTSLMIRDIPNDFSRRRLMSIIDEHCFIENQQIPAGAVKSEYDFLYVPIDFRTLANKGYAFVNMTSPEAALRLWKHLHGHRWEFRRCGKICAVDYAATQGLENLLDRFSGSSFGCDNEEFLPVMFEPPRDGTRPAVSVLHVLGSMRQ